MRGHVLAGAAVLVLPGGAGGFLRGRGRQGCRRRGRCRGGRLCGLVRLRLVRRGRLRLRLVRLRLRLVRRARLALLRLEEVSQALGQAHRERVLVAVRGRLVGVAALRVLGSLLQPLREHLVGLRDAAVLGHVDATRLDVAPAEGILPSVRLHAQGEQTGDRALFPLVLLGVAHVDLLPDIEVLVDFLKHHQGSVLVQGVELGLRGVQRHEGLRLAQGRRHAAAGAPCSAQHQDDARHEQSGAGGIPAPRPRAACQLDRARPAHQGLVVGALVVGALHQLPERLRERRHGSRVRAP
mmetsp:Transcript_68789/g.201908  ORF Transcript_68789/g.201908 Transcript_68789/m.201908 type:complete len:296 (+) Transcript_68789:975-1862(+)